MRRSDRKITAHNEILDVLRKCDVIRIGINTQDYPYIVPMCFGFEDTKPLMTVFLHCALEGRKLDLILKDRRIGFEADCSYKVIAGENACNYTMEYESIVGNGIISICDEYDWKRRGLQAIMRHYEPEREFEFTEQQLDAVCVLHIDVMEITGKRLKKDVLVKD